MNERDQVNTQIKGKARNFDNQMREAKMKLKAETEMQRKIMGDINQKHLEILRLEEKQKQIQEKVKNQKEKGFSPRSSKVAIEREQ